MEIKRIVVDELPKKCYGCAFCQYVNYELKCLGLPEEKDGKGGYNRLYGINMFNYYKRPDCPLVVEE